MIGLLYLDHQQRLALVCCQYFLILYSYSNTMFCIVILLPLNLTITRLFLKKTEGHHKINIISDIHSHFVNFTFFNINIFLKL